MSIINNQQATIIPKRKIGNISATITLEEIASDDLEITQHPVQQGAAITDHAYVKPATVSIRIMFNDAEKPLAEIYRDLIDLQASREPFDVVTGKRIYKNMLFRSLGQTTDAQTENILSIRAELQEVFIVEVQTTTISIAPRRQQANPAKTGATESAGQKKAQTANEQQSKSALAILGGR